MDASDITKLFREKLDEISKGSRDRMVDGKAEDYSDYKFHCGYLKGVNAAYDAMKNVLARLNNHQEDED